MLMKKNMKTSIFDGDTSNGGLGVYIYLLLEVMTLSIIKGLKEKEGIFGL